MNALPAVRGVELNVSCPNVKDGLTFGTDADLLRDLTKACKAVLPDKPLMVKLSPNVPDICVTAQAACDGGADVLTLVNTFTAMTVDVNTQEATPRQRHRRAQRARDQADRVAPRQPGLPQRHPAQRRPDRRHGGCADVAGCGRVHPRRRLGRRHRDGAVCRPVDARTSRRRPGRLVQATGRGSSGRSCGCSGVTGRSAAGAAEDALRLSGVRRI